MRRDCGKAYVKIRPEDSPIRIDKLGAEPSYVRSPGLGEIEEFLTDHEGKSEITPHQIKAD